jgi:type VI secretion system protein ImpJ
VTKPILPVRWSEGMFLKPHHFQQADLYQDARLGYHLRALNPFHWGVYRLRVDVDALENLVFRVESCEVVFPDGLIVAFPDGALLEPASFQDEFPSTADSLGVFLAARRPDPEQGVADRFGVRTEPRRDLFLRDNEAGIDFLVPRARLVFAQSRDDERLGGSEAVKLTEVRRTGRTSPRFELAPQYVPPALSLHAAPALAGMVGEVVERLCAASRVLGQHRRERGPEALGYGVGDLEQLLTRQVINQFVPALQNALANASLHPYAVYGLLAELRGALTSYWPEEEAWAFPAYEHTDLAGCFGPLCESIRRLLDRLLPTHYLELPLAREGFQFSTPLEEGVFGRASAFVLALHGALGEEALRKRIETHAKVSSVADMRQLVSFADRGVPLRFLDHPPAEIPRYAGYVYFRLDTADRRWGRVKEGGDFAFFLADADPDLEARLFVVLGRGERRGA